MQEATLKMFKGPRLSPEKLSLFTFACIMWQGKGRREKKIIECLHVETWEKPTRAKIYM